MAVLNFGGGSTDQVDHTSFTAGDDLANLTFMAWVKLTRTTGADMRIFTKAYIGAHSSFHYLVYGPTFGGLVYERDRVTTDTNVAALAASFSIASFTDWFFIAVQSATGGANGDQKIIVGNRTVLAAEPSSYSGQTVGSGALVTDASGPWVIGNRGGGAAVLDGQVAFIALYNRILSLGEIRAQQFSPHVQSGCLIHSWYGFNGTTSCVDHSGNGHNGTITGTTLSNQGILKMPCEI